MEHVAISQNITNLAILTLNKIRAFARRWRQEVSRARTGR